MMVQLGFLLPVSVSVTREQQTLEIRVSHWQLQHKYQFWVRR